jgi:hypothetical protein
VELALEMIQRGVNHGIRSGYVVFDSWYGWPSVIKGIGEIKGHLHVVCRVKDSKTLYKSKDKGYRLSELYRKEKPAFKKNRRMGLVLPRVNVKLPGSEEQAVIVFSKGYCEPEDDAIKGKMKDKEPNWIAFLSTNTNLHESTLIKIHQTLDHRGLFQRVQTTPRAPQRSE